VRIAHARTPAHPIHTVFRRNQWQPSCSLSRMTVGQVAFEGVSTWKDGPRTQRFDAAVRLSRVYARVCPLAAMAVAS